MSLYIQLKFKLRIYLLSLMIFSSYPVIADEKIDCTNPDNAVAQRECNGQEFLKLDKEMNVIWKEALSKVPADGTTDDKRKERHQFISAQKAWLKYRDEQCAFDGGLQGGSNLWVTIFAQQCEISDTTERIKFLKQIVKGL